MPPEVIHIILENLSQTDVKQARLVSNKWAAIGARSLNVHTVYLSPRDKDMEVFEVITQHPIFRATAKHLVFDSAQFIKLSEEHYITAFIRDLEAQAEYYECSYAQPSSISSTSHSRSQRVIRQSSTEITRMIAFEAWKSLWTASANTRSMSNNRTYCTSPGSTELVADWKLFLTSKL